MPASRNGRSSVKDACTQNPIRVEVIGFANEASGTQARNGGCGR